MKNYDVRIYNDCGSLIYGNNIVAKNETEAVIELLTRDHVILSSGDKITIDELF